MINDNRYLMDDYRQMVSEIGDVRRIGLINDFLSSIEFNMRTGWENTDYDKLFLAYIKNEHEKATAATAAKESTDT